jgi:hypothetical protein
MALHNEIEFENEICEHLGSNGWLYEADDASKFVRGLALFPEDVVAWVKETQPDAWDGFYDNHEVERVVAVELDPNAKQKQLEAAINPVEAHPAGPSKAL